MPRQPTRLSPTFLALYRPGALVAVAEGLPANIPARRPVGYQVHASAQVAEAGAAGDLPETSPGTAVVPVRGVLEQRASEWSCGETDGYDAIEERLLAALLDPSVGQVVLDVDSPGGDLPGLEEGIERMRASVLAFGKPVVGYVGSLAASAALWLICGVCDTVCLHLSARMGSVGCVVVHGNDAAKLAKEGTEVYVARNPPGKMVPNSLEALDELGKSRLDAQAKEGSDRFIAAVSTLRRIPIATISEWNGALFTGAAAIAAGLADAAGSLEDTIAFAQSLAALQEAA